MKRGILGFNLEQHSLDVLEGPPRMEHCYSHQIVQTEEDAVGVAMMSHHHDNIEMWQRKINCHGVATWELWKTIETEYILGLPPLVEGETVWVKFIRGYVEDTDEIFLCMKDTVYMVQLNSMQSRKLCETRSMSSCHPFNSFYASGSILCSSYLIFLCFARGCSNINAR